MSSFRKELRNSKALNAFNDSFDEDKLNAEVEKAVANKEDERDISVASIIGYYNSVYNGYYSYVKRFLQVTSLTIGELEEVMIANANRLQLLMGNRAVISMEESVVLSNNSLFIGNYDNLKMKSDLLNKDIYIRDAAENYIDGLNSVISYFQYFDRLEAVGELKEPEAINQFMNVSIITNKMAALKTSYDALIWEDNFVVNEENKYYIKFKDENFAKLLRIGKFKLEASISTLLIKTMKQMQTSAGFNKFMLGLFERKRKPRELDKISVKDGYIIPVVKKGRSGRYENDLGMHVAVAGYYNFVMDVDLPKADNLTVADIIVLFSELRELVDATKSLSFNNDNYLTIDALYDYPFKISENDMIRYLQAKTYYDVNQIKSFVNIITHDSGRVDFWKRPFIKRGNALLFPLLPIIGANILNVLDEWLEAGGFSLDKRGELFEDYIKQTIQESMNEKGFMCHIYPNNFLRVGEKFEEIDLLVEMQSCILIAEVKCVRYPIEPRDKYNLRDTILKGAKQLNRKIGFINSNKAHFIKEVPGLKSKPIVKVVITNYPLMNTWVVNDIPVTDLTALEHYIDEGKIAKGYSSIDEFGRTDSSQAKIVNYYNDEVEFCQNMDTFFKRPVSMDVIMPMAKIEEIELTDEKEPVRVFFDSVLIEQNNVS